MAKAPDNDERRDPQLSPKAREIKKQIDEGRYDIDLGALADALVDARALDVTPELAADEGGSPLAQDDLAQDGLAQDGLAQDGLAQNDQKPTKD